MTAPEAAGHPQGAPPRVATLELFFDLVFAFTLAAERHAAARGTLRPDRAGRMGT